MARTFSSIPDAASTEKTSGKQQRESRVLKMTTRMFHLVSLLRSSQKFVLDCNQVELANKIKQSKTFWNEKGASMKFLNQAPKKKTGRVAQILAVAALSVSTMLLAPSPSPAKQTTGVLMVSNKGIKTFDGRTIFSKSHIINYKDLFIDITKKKPYKDPSGRMVTIPNNAIFKNANEVTFRFWHPRNEPRLLDGIVVKSYDKKGHLIHHGVFDRGVFVSMMIKDLFHGKWVELQDVGTFVKGDKSLYVKVRIRHSQQIALVPFATFLQDFANRINTEPVISWAVK